MVPSQHSDAETPSSTAYLLAGMQAGMAATFIMLAWLGFTGVWFRHGFWRSSNVLSMIFFGERGLDMSFGIPTVVAVALQLLIYSVAGCFFAMIVADRLRSIGLLLCGVAAGVAIYFVLFGYLWTRINALVPLYTHDRPMLVAHILYGGMLARFPKYLHR